MRSRPVMINSFSLLSLCLQGSLPNQPAICFKGNQGVRWMCFCSSLLDIGLWRWNALISHDCWAIQHFGKVLSSVYRVSIFDDVLNHMSKKGWQLHQVTPPVRVAVFGFEAYLLQERSYCLLELRKQCGIKRPSITLTFFLCDFPCTMLFVCNLWKHGYFIFHAHTSINTS